MSVDAFVRSGCHSIPSIATCASWIFSSTGVLIPWVYRRSHPACVYFSIMWEVIDSPWGERYNLHRVIWYLLHLMRDIRDRISVIEHVRDLWRIRIGDDSRISILLSDHSVSLYPGDLDIRLYFSRRLRLCVELAYQKKIIYSPKLIICR